MTLALMAVFTRFNHVIRLTDKSQYHFAMSILKDTHINILLQVFSVIIGVILFSHFYGIINKRFLKTVSKYLCVACIAHSVFIFTDHFNISYYDLLATPGKKGAYAGVLANSGYSGLYIASTLPFVISIFWPLVVFPLTAIILLTVFQTSITPILMVGVIFMTLLLYRNWRFIFLGLIGIPFLPKAWEHFLSDARIPNWLVAWDNFKHYFLGEGVGWMVGHYFHQPQKANPFNKMHNDYFELLVVFGILGFCLLIPFFKNILKRSVWEYHASLLAVMFGSLFWFSFHLPSIVGVSLMSIALINRRDI